MAKMSNESEKSKEHANKHDHKKFEIIVNARPRPWNEETISYSQVVDLAYPGQRSPNQIFTV
jgi:hypothetical protein